MKPIPARGQLPLPALLALFAQQPGAYVVRLRDEFFDGELHIEDGAVRSVVFGALVGDGAMSALSITDELHYEVESGPTDALHVVEPAPTDELHDAVEPALAEPAPVAPEVANIRALIDDELKQLALARREEEESARPESISTRSRRHDGEDRSVHETLLGLGVYEAQTRSSGSEPPPAFESRSASSASEPPPVFEPLAASSRNEPPAALVSPSPRYESAPAAPPNFAHAWSPSEAEEYPELIAKRPSKGLSLRFGDQESAASAQDSVMPTLFVREGPPAVWIVVALCAPLLFMAMFCGTQSERVVQKPAAVASAEPIIDASLAEGVPPRAPAGTLAPTVLLRVQVAEDGKVKQAHVQSPRPGLGQLEKQAVETVRNYRFRPATQGGRPLESWLTLPLAFVPTTGPREITIKGSDTIGAALGPTWSRAVEQALPGLKIRVEALGSSTGFEGLLDGTAAVGASSRPIRSEELAFASRLGVQLREVVAAYDGIAVIVHRDNPLRTLDLESVARIFAQRVQRWSELSGPDAPIHVLGRPSYSGTHAFLRERMLAVLGPGGSFGPSVESLEASKDIVARVESDVHAIGYVGIGNLQPSVRALSIALRPKEAGVSATPETIRDGSYPIARPLYLYLRADSGHEARTWVDYALSAPGQAAVASHGFVPLHSPLASALTEEIAAPHVLPPELTRIYFDQGSVVIEPDSRTELMAAAAALRAGKRALVIGHADSAGKAETNEVLAQQRALAVAAQLRQFGNRAALIDVEVAAANHPLASNTTADGRRANRRVDVILQSR